MLLFLAIVLAWVQLGLGGLFGGSLEQLLSFDTGTYRGRHQIVQLLGMWASLAAALEAIVVAAVLALHQRGRRP